MKLSRFSKHTILALILALPVGQALSGSIEGSINNICPPGAFCVPDPISGADVYVLDARNAEIVAVTTTDATGYFQSDPLPAGTYKIRVYLEDDTAGNCKLYKEFLNDSGVHEDVFAYGTNFDVEAEGATSVTSAVAANSCPYCLAATYFLETQGTVLDDDTGSPISSITVNVKDATNAMPIFTLETDVNGNFYQQMMVRDSCGPRKVAKVRFSDPTGPYGSEYHEDQFDEFDLGTAVNLSGGGGILGEVRLSSTSVDAQTEALKIQVIEQQSPQLVLFTRPLETVQAIVRHAPKEWEQLACVPLTVFTVRARISEQMGLFEDALNIAELIGCWGGPWGWSGGGRGYGRGYGYGYGYPYYGYGPYGGVPDGDIADFAEKVGDRLRLLIAR